mmetsp:Transcript_7328/g.17117  ORF Transcript_7328/g.17117 Transcript_7328/m.17117 type:complete len:426 (-) Transcript_7328:298-1575(-)|eukprot:CAMPEP_0119355304 /NCGR_PEP_ID=MMETSP1334-20130426/4146_1 /TAXON_ID=127549 /ORGANISM="Calcidiscus leptoporus, Strain RCC1130" /LENGTH=425 /DNA_ID=CAMNT_0007369091 /DNA_START=110 /DNA_END=1387 /DNA_ORIENTATION=+
MPAAESVLLQLPSRVQRLYCSATDICHQFGGVQYGSIQLSRNATQRHVFLEKYGIAVGGISGWVPDHVRCWRMLVPPVVDALAEAGLFFGATATDVARNGQWSFYHFGVFKGASLYYYRKQFPRAFFAAFDSFSGLPPEQPGEMTRSTWLRGTFDVKERDIMTRLIDDLGGSERIRVDKGFFNETLTPELARSLQPAAIVDIDSDIYISAFQALDWLFEHKLVRPGTLVVYDDWMDYTCAPLLSPSALANVPEKEATRGMSIGVYGRQSNLYKSLRSGGMRFPGMFAGGEPKAHLEIAHKYGVDFRCVAGSCASSQKTVAAEGADCRRSPHRAFGALFVIAAIGSSPNHGVMMDEEQLSAYRSSDRDCKMVTASRFTLDTSAAATAATPAQGDLLANELRQMVEQGRSRPQLRRPEAKRARKIGK